MNVNNIDQFMQKIYDNPNHRYTSWEICYRSFQNENLSNEIKSLHLASYLCSWGMYRGSSQLLNEYNYMIFNNLIDLLNEYMELRKDFLEESEYEKFLEFIHKIKSFLKNKNISSTKTLITKIILGVYGCFPALDNYFIKGYRSNGYTFSEKVLTNIQKFNVFYTCLKNFYITNERIFNNKRQEIEANRGIDYPAMKLIDMYFWMEGKK